MLARCSGVRYWLLTAVSSRPPFSNSAAATPPKPPAQAACRDVFPVTGSARARMNATCPGEFSATVMISTTHASEPLMAAMCRASGPSAPHGINGTLFSRQTLTIVGALMAHAKVSALSPVSSSTQREGSQPSENARRTSSGRFFVTASFRA